MTATLDDVVSELRSLREKAEERNELVAKEILHMADIKLKMETVATKSDIDNLCEEQEALRTDLREDRKSFVKVVLAAFSILSSLVTGITSALIIYFKG